MVPPPLLNVDPEFKLKSPEILVFPEGSVSVDPLLVATLEKLIVPVPPTAVFPPNETIPVPPENDPPVLTVQLDPFIVRLLEPVENVPPEIKTFPFTVTPLLAKF